MKNLILDRDPVIFLGTADGAIQKNKSASDELRLEIATLSVLGYKTAIGTPFLWQSQATFNAFEKSRPLFDLPIGPVLTGRPGISTIEDYFYQRQHDTNTATSLCLDPESPFRTEHPGSASIDWQRHIAPATRISSRQGSVETEFKRLFLQDTSGDSSNLSLYQLMQTAFAARFSLTGKNRAEGLLGRVADTIYRPHFSRAVVEDSLSFSNLVLDQLPRILYRTSALYQAANAKAHSQVLFTTPEVAQQIRYLHDLTIVSRISVSPFNPYFFVELLRVIGVQPAAWGSVNEKKMAAACNTQNPLRMFAEVYKAYFWHKLFEWEQYPFKVNYSQALRHFADALLRNNDWRQLEPMTPLSGRKFDSLAVGLTVGSTGAILGFNPLQVGSAARQITEYGYKLLDGLKFFEILSMRRDLRRYLSKELGLSV